jgi:hypothetical protein
MTALDLWGLQHSLTDLRSSMHGSVTGLTRKDVFDADFVFIL